MLAVFVLLRYKYIRKAPNYPQNRDFPGKKCKKIRTLPRPRKQKKTEDGFQASPVSFFFGCSILIAPSIAPSMIGRYSSGHSFSL